MAHTAWRAAWAAPGIAACLLLAACTGFRAAPSPPISDQATVFSKLETVYSPTAIVDCLMKSLSQQDDCRNQIVQALLIAIDYHYSEFEVQFFDADRYGRLGASWSQLALTGAASVSAGGVAKILAAIATGVKGGEEAFTREVLAEKTSLAIETAMRAQRDTIATRIRVGLALPATQYPLGIALSDLDAYFRAGTIPGALATVTQATGVQAQAAQDELRNAMPISRTPAALFLRRFIEQGDAPTRTANLQALRRAMTNAGVPATVGTTQFVFAPGPSNAARQEQVARALGWLP